MTGLSNPVSATVSPDGASVYVACTTGGDAVVVFDANVTSDRLVLRWSGIGKRPP